MPNYAQLKDDEANIAYAFFLEQKKREDSFGSAVLFAAWMGMPLALIKNTEECLDDMELHISDKCYNRYKALNSPHKETLFKIIDRQSPLYRVKGWIMYMICGFYLCKNIIIKRLPIF